MVTRAEIVAKAREYVGTPFHHQGRKKGVGVDCVGLLFAVGRDLGMPWRNVDGYPDVPDPTTMRALIGEQMDEIAVDAIQPGDALLFWIEAFVRHPQHMAIVSDRPRGLGIIHAYRPKPVYRTVEIDLSDDWRKRVIGAYAFRLA